MTILNVETIYGPDARGWLGDLKFDDAANGRNIFYIQEDWNFSADYKRNFNRILKCFCPNPSRYPELYLIPERFQNGSQDLPKSGESDRLGSVSEKDLWLSDMIALLKQIDASEEGSRLLKSVGQEPITIPDSIDKLKEWRPEDGYYTLCDEKGAPIPDKRKAGFCVIMGPSSSSIREGVFNTCASLGPSPKIGYGERRVVTFDPRITLKLGVDIDRNGNAKARSVFFFAAVMLAHELIHIDHLLKGLSFPAATIKEVTRETIDPKTKEVRTVTSKEETLEYGNWVYEPILDREEWVNEMLYQNAACKVHPEEASTTTLDGFRCANGNFVKLATCAPATEELKRFQDKALSTSDPKINSATKAHLVDSIELRIKQYGTLPFIEQELSWSILSAPRELGGIGLPPAEVEKYTRHSYGDIDHEAIVHNPETGEIEFRSYVYATENPLDPRHGNTNKLQLYLGQCPRGVPQGLGWSHQACIPGIEQKSPDSITSFEPLTPEDIETYAREKVRILLDRGAGPDAVQWDFKASMGDLRFRPGSIFLGLKNTAEHLNVALGEVMGPEGVRMWLSGIVHAFEGDADALSKATAVSGIVPVVGDLMGILDGAVHGNWEELTLSGLALLAVLAGQAVPLVGEIMDIALGLYMLLTSLIDLIKEVFGDEPSDVDVMRKVRDGSWRDAVIKQSDTIIIPKMEEAWRRYEQGLIISFSLTIAMVDATTEKANKEAKTDAERRQINADATKAKDRMWERFAWFLVEASVNFQAQMQNTLRLLLTDQENFSAFSQSFVEDWAARSGGVVAHNCMSLPPVDLWKCVEMGSERTKYVKGLGTRLTKDPVPQEIPSEIWESFDKSGRFFPRVLPFSTLPAPHVTGGEASTTFAKKAVVKWAPLKTLPEPMIAKVLLQVRGDRVTHTSSAADRQATFDDPKSTQQDPKHHEITLYFETPDIAGFPQVDDSDRRIDRKLLGTKSVHWHRVDGALKDIDLSSIPLNFGYGSLVGDYMIVSEQTGLAMDVRYDLFDSAAVVQSTPTGSDSQTWKIAADGPTADRRDRWTATELINTNSGQSLSIASGNKLSVATAGSDDNSRKWYFTMPEEAHGFILKNLKTTTLVVNPAAETDAQLTVGAETANARWVFVPVRQNAPTADRHYSIINDWSGLALDFSDRDTPAARPPNLFSPFQTFHLDRGNSAGAIVLHNRFRDRFLHLTDTSVSMIEKASSGACLLRPAWGGAWMITTASGKVLECSSRLPGALGLTVFDPDAGRPGQLWRLAEVITAVPNGWSTVTAAATGLALAVKGTDPSDGLKIQLEALSKDTPQRWALNQINDEEHTLTFLATSGKLAAPDGSAPSDRVAQYQNPSPNGSHWRLCPTPGGTWIIHNSASGEVLEADAPTDAKGKKQIAELGATLVQHDFHNTDSGENLPANANQLWSIDPLPTARIPIGLSPTKFPILRTSE